MASGRSHVAAQASSLGGRRGSERGGGDPWERSGLGVPRDTLGLVAGDCSRVLA